MSKTQKEFLPKIAFALTILSGIVLLITASVQAVSILTKFGFQDVFSKIDLTDDAKVQVALYLTFPILGSSLIFWGGFQTLRGLTKRGGIFSLCGAILGLAGLLIPQNLGFDLLYATLIGTVFAAVFAGASSIIGFRTPITQVEKGPILTTIEVATVGIFSAMAAVLTGLVGGIFPSPTGGYTHLGDTIIFMAALLFGCKVGTAAGAIGSVVADLYVGYPRWFVSVPAHGIEGALAGLAKGKRVVVQVILCAIGGFIMATVYFYVNIFIKGYPVAIISYARDLGGQVGISLVLGVTLTKIVEKMLPQLRR